MDEAGFNLTNKRRRGRNVCWPLGHCWCSWAAWWQCRIMCCHQQWGCPPSCQPGALQHSPAPHFPQSHVRCSVRSSRMSIPSMLLFGTMRFHRTLQVSEWFTINHGFINLCLPPYSPFLNPIEEIFSSWRWKGSEHQSYTRVNLLQAVGLACGDIL